MAFSIIAKQVIGRGTSGGNARAASCRGFMICRPVSPAMILLAASLAVGTTVVFQVGCH
jgi:hypothetical protein